MTQRNLQINNYIKNLPDWQQDICNTIRNIIHEADPDIDEVIKFTNRPYFELHGNVCALLATKDHVNLFIYDPIVADPDNIINQGQNNKTARTMQIYQGSIINEVALLKLIKSIVTHNRGGGWRKIINN